MEWLLAHLLEIFLGLFSAGLLALCKHFHSQMKIFKNLSREKSQEEIVQLIQDEVKPIIKEIHHLQDQLQDIQDKECRDV